MTLVNKRSLNRENTAVTAVSDNGVNERDVNRLIRRVAAEAERRGAVIRQGAAGTSDPRVQHCQGGCTLVGLEGALCRVCRMFPG